MRGTIPAPQKAPVQSVNGMTGDVTLKLGDLEVAWGVETTVIPAGEKAISVDISFGKIFSTAPKRLVCPYGNLDVMVCCGWDSETTTEGFKAYVHAATVNSSMDRNVRIMWLAWV